MSTLPSLSTSLSTRFQPAITIGCDSELGRIQSVWAEYQFFICSSGFLLLSSIPPLSLLSTVSVPFFCLLVFRLYSGSYDCAPLSRESLPRERFAIEGCSYRCFPGCFALLTPHPFSHSHRHWRQLNVSFLTNSKRHVILESIGGKLTWSCDLTPWSIEICLDVLNKKVKYAGCRIYFFLISRVSLSNSIQIRS